MTGGIQHYSTAQAHAALAWLVEAGVDALVDEAPFAWLAGPARVQAPPPPVAEPLLPCAADAVVEARAAVAGIDSLAALQAALTEFDGCTLAQAGQPPVFAEGAPGAAVMIVGEMPGADVLGGDAGRLLDRMLAAIGLRRDAVYIANAVYWPTPGGRSPAAAEIAACAPFLARHIELAAPRVVLALGGTAAAALTGNAGGIARVRGNWHDVRGGARQVLPTFHPAQLLAQPGLKALAWRDLLALKARLAA